MSIVGLTSYRPIPRAQFVDEDGEIIPNREKSFSTQKNVLPDESMEAQLEQTKWDQKLEPRVRTTDIGPLLWKSDDAELTQLQQEARQQLETAIAFAEEIRLLTLNTEINKLEAHGEELISQARLSKRKQPALIQQKGSLQSVINEWGMKVNKQTAKVITIQSQRPPDSDFPTKGEMTEWATKLVLAEEKLKDMKEDLRVNSLGFSLAEAKLTNAEEDLKDAKRAIAVNSVRLNQLKRLAGIPISEAKSSSYRSANSFGLS